MQITIDSLVDGARGSQLLCGVLDRSGCAASRERETICDGCRFGDSWRRRWLRSVTNLAVRSRGDSMDVRSLVLTIVLFVGRQQA